MAIATVPIEDVNELLEQARKLDNRAEALRQEASLIGREAGELRVLASSLTRSPVPVNLNRPMADDFMRSKILGVLDDHGPCSTSHIANHLRLTQVRVRAMLNRMQDEQIVKRCGLKRGSVWTRFEDASMQSVAHVGEDARTIVRDAARKLGTFTFPEICTELQMLADVTVRRWLAQMEEDGTLDVEKVGTSKLYDYPRPEGEPANRVKHETPERKAVVQFNRRQGPVVGTGKGQRAASPVVNELLRELREYPQVEIKRRSHKFAFYFNGQEISSCSLTPGASALGDTRRRLRQAGVMVAA